MNFIGVNHIAIIATDLAQSKDFYVDKLGFEIASRHDRPEKHDIILNLVKNGLRLEIFIKPNAPKRPSYPEATGLRHLAFTVNHIEDIVAELKSQGIAVQEIRHDSFTGEKMVFFTDPDGLPIELHE
ncbi:VOC family protein [Oenococcus sp.]|uniref:SMU1112c/YaeR family gloxylase I-like metalloprotein n=1 Tax=Oenococcus sp. TaxID=1979414 RepID=UPI0039E90F47